MNTRQRARKVNTEAPYIVTHEFSKVRVTLKRTDILKTLKCFNLIQVKAESNHSLALVIYVSKNLE